MDLFNNERGRFTARFSNILNISNISNIFTDIYQDHLGGNLKYLNNLEPNDPVRGHATINSILKPTNQ